MGPLRGQTAGFRLITYQDSRISEGLQAATSGSEVYIVITIVVARPPTGSADLFDLKSDAESARAI